MFEFGLDVDLPSVGAASAKLAVCVEAADGHIAE